MYHQKKLKNGLRVVVAPMPSTETVTVLVLVRAGSKYETKRTNGLAHFLEHLFFKGTAKRPSPLEVAETLDRVGGEYNAFTSKEEAGYYAKVDRKHLELAIDWVSDMLLHPLIKAEDVEREKGVIAQEINMDKDNPMGHVGDLFEELLYGDQPAGWDIAGTKEGVAKLTQKDAMKYLHERYVASETVVAIAGNVQVKQAEQLVSAYFQTLKRGRAPGKKRVKEFQRVPQLTIQKRTTDQTHLILGVRAFDTYDKRRYALSLLATILGSSMSSRLFLNLREKHGLAYYVYSRPEFYTDTGYLATHAGVANNDLTKAVSIIMEEYSLLLHTEVGADELRKAKDYTKGKMLIGLESSNAVAGFGAEQIILHGKAKAASEVVKKIEAVTAADIQAVAKSIFRNQCLNLAAIGPGGQEKALKKVLSFKS